MIDTVEEALIDQMKRHEGFERLPYKCSEDVWSIGYGLNLEQGITEEEAAWLLTHRLFKARIELMKSGLLDGLKPGMGSVRLSVLYNMAYNLGVPRLRKFRMMWRHLHAGEYEGAAHEMLNSLWARQVGDRAVELAAQMRTGAWQKAP